MAKLKGGMALDFSLEKSRVKEEVGQCHLLFVFSSKVLFCQESITQEYESGFRFVLISVRKCLLMECFHVTSRWPCWCPQLILRELSSIIMLEFPFVSVEKQGY